MPRIDLVRIACTLVALSLMQPVYAADKFPDYPVRQAGDYAIRAENEGLTIGVQPVDDLKDQKTYFHAELTPRGFVPVFVVIQNGSSEDSFLFDKTSIKYGEADSNNSIPKPGEKAAEGLAIGSLAALSMVGMIVALKLASNASQAEYNIVKREVQSKTMRAGVKIGHSRPRERCVAAE